MEQENKNMIEFNPYDFFLERKVELVKAIIPCSDYEQDIVGELLALKKIYEKKYDDVILSIETDEESKETSAVLTFVRKENEYEKEMRVKTETGNNSGESWLAKYSQLTGASKKEAKENMDNMVAANIMVTPEEWLERKKKVLENFFNINKKG